MATLNWTVFDGLPGAAHSNFELLCRALIRRHYGRFGDFASLAAQPGVEFHLRLHTACSLGKPGQWYGWQCKWYRLPAGRAIGGARRAKIEKAIRISERTLPSLTHWVLWTRHPLTAGDQKWLRGLRTRMKLLPWTAAEVEEHLSGDAEIFRASYFGELVLTPELLDLKHKEAAARIGHRWRPEVHQVIDAERSIQRMLGRPAAWRDLLELAKQLKTGGEALQRDRTNLSAPVAQAAADVAGLADVLSAKLQDMYAAFERGDLDSLQEKLRAQPKRPNANLKRLPRQLRAIRAPAALSATNALADISAALDIHGAIDRHLRTRLVAVLADAGCGKTQLAAQLTAGAGGRPPGVLLHGRDLNAGHNLNDLAHCVVIHGTPIASMERLLAAVDAAGQRLHQRLPIAIDGLNESEDPRDWKGLLGTLGETLRQHPYVMVVCTLRTAFADDALPPEVERLEIPGFELDTTDAVRRYFAYYKIDPVDSELPMILRHPLTLSLFCEVTNPTREQRVGAEAMPGSLTALFGRYLAQAKERIAELAPRTRRYYQQDITAALDQLSTLFWERRSRDLDEHEVRVALGDETRPWNESIIRALEHEGVILRAPGPQAGRTRVSAAYDALAGHLVADTLIVKLGRSELPRWLNDNETQTSLGEPAPKGHPLGTDIFRALVALVPRRLPPQQLWPLLRGSLRTTALRGAADLEGRYLDADSVNALRNTVAVPAAGVPDILYRLWHTRGLPSHPLNAQFLDTVLRPMSVASRDLRWTEWIRRHEEETLRDLNRLEERWRQRLGVRTPSDRLRARWVMWVLTSTVREIRDRATRALYWFGRGEPAALFDLILGALDVNDLYVPERLLAAGYGVVLAQGAPSAEVVQALRAYFTGLRDALTGPRATHPTSHWLARLYVQNAVSFALAFCPDAIPKGIHVHGKVPFAGGQRPEPIGRDDPRVDETGWAIQMDFENYTVGTLFKDRQNYDMKHSGHRDALAHVRGVLSTLGWRKAELGKVDEAIGSYGPRGYQRATERYGKKYSWIGFHTYAGILADQGRLPPGRLSDLHVDPSFPEPPEAAPIDLPAWATSKPAKDRDWAVSGPIPLPDRLLCCRKMLNHAGPWIAVHAYLDSDKQAAGREIFAFLTAMLVEQRDLTRLIEILQRKEHPGQFRLAQIPGDYYTFAGEIPWSPEFARADDYPIAADLYRETLDDDNGRPVVVETLAHKYAWESYHSEVNKAGSALVPSRSFSAAYNLRAVPQSFHQTLSNGTPATLSFSAPSSFHGQILYLREDLLSRYAGRRQLVWYIWGERELTSHLGTVAPDWLMKVRQEHRDTWRVVRLGRELSGAFRRKDRRPAAPHDSKALVKR